MAHGCLGGDSECQLSPNACAGSVPLPTHLLLFWQGQLPVGTVYTECSTLDSSRLQTISCPLLILATHNPSFHAFRQISKLQEGVLRVLLVHSKARTAHLLPHRCAYHMRCGQLALSARVPSCAMMLPEKTLDTCYRTKKCVPSCRIQGVT